MLMLDVYHVFSCFFLKIILWLGMIVGTLFIPTAAMSVFAHIAAVGAGIFIVVQIIVLLDFAYGWNVSWVSRGEDNKGWLVAVLVCSVVMLAGCVALVVLMGAWMIQGGGCGREIAFIVITCLAIAVFTVVSCTEWCEKGSLLSASVVAIYAMYLCWSALSSDPAQCIQKSSGGTFQLVAGMIIAVVSILYAAFSASSADGAFSLSVRYRVIDVIMYPSSHFHGTQFSLKGDDKEAMLLHKNNEEDHGT